MKDRYIDFSKMNNEMLLAERYDPYSYVRNQTPITVIKTQGRNEPCKCGSGKKFKRCCISK